jgi:NLI interacting factor-like phosphatase
MGPSGSNYRDQGVQSGSLNPQSSKEERERGVELAGDFSSGERREPPVSDYIGENKEKSLAILGSWDAGSKSFTRKPERFMPSYDMDDSSFFAHTTRLNIEGPHSDSTRFLRRRSSSTERSLISRGERTMATAATAFQKSDRSRSPSPPITLVPEKPTSPTDSYLQISLQSSLPLADPTASRKLLVLDLNGTLLLRSAHSGRRVPPPSYSRGRHSADSHSSSTRPYPVLRTIYPRPYLPPFVAYIFHPTTLQWLDTMVWSSAQPHSVNDMVDKCFGAYKETLKAVWARDTLGLSGDEYCEYMLHRCNVMILKISAT